MQVDRVRSSRPTTSAASSARRIDEAFAEHLGRAFGTEAVAAGEKAVAVGRDGRLSGPALVAALMRGLASTGLDVVDLGAVTTPMLYYVAATRGRAWLPLAASRSPAATTRRTTTASRWCWPGARSTATTSSACAGASRPSATRTGTGPHRRRWTSRAEYRARIVGDAKLARPMKIVVDSGNGIPGASAPGILRALGCEVTSCTPRSMATSRTTTPTRASPRTWPT